MTEIERLNIHIKLLTSRLEALERMVRKDKPVPQRDTIWHWHPHDVRNGCPVFGVERVVVLLRGEDKIKSPHRAEVYCWSENGDSTIIAWRYAKEGE